MPQHLACRNSIVWCKIFVLLQKSDFECWAFTFTEYCKTMVLLLYLSKIGSKSSPSPLKGPNCCQQALVAGQTCLTFFFLVICRWRKCIIWAVWHLVSLLSCCWGSDPHIISSLWWETSGTSQSGPALEKKQDVDVGLAHFHFKWIQNNNSDVVQHTHRNRQPVWCFWLDWVVIAVVAWFDP